MRLVVISSSSKGNAYLLENDSEALLIECGVRFDAIKRALHFNLRKVVACLLTHEHNDHSLSAKEVIKAGIDVWASGGTLKQIGMAHHHRAHAIKSGQQFVVGGFKVKAFDVKHDVAEPLGFLIQHEETGRVLFLTDSYYCEYTFEGLNNIIIEANYCESILRHRYDEEGLIKVLRDRVIESHMSLKTCKEMLSANDLRAVNNIVLIHLSDSNSDAARFKREVEQQTGKVVHVADAGVVIEPFNKTPF